MPRNRNPGKPGAHFIRELKAVVFDCDGVMFDSGQANRAYYDHILKNMNKPGMTDEQFAFAHMATVFGTLEMLFPDPEELSAAYKVCKATTYHPFIELMVIEPDLKDLLAYLRLQYKTGVSTNRTNTMGSVLKTHSLSHLFDTVVTALDVKNPKPHPDSLIKAAKDLDVLPHEAVYIGDSTVDAEASQAAAMPFIAFGNPDLDADIHVGSMMEIRRLFQGDS